MKIFLTGSLSWFEGIDGFKPHDTDYCVFLEGKETIDDIKIESKDKVNDFQIGTHIRDEKNKKCFFVLRYNNKNDIIIASLMSCYLPVLCSLCDPNIAKYLGITVNDLLPFKKFINYFSYRYFYIKKIYEYILLNNDFYLTREQLNNVYNIYKETKCK